MANRDSQFPKCLGYNRLDITGSFQPNGASTSVLNVKGNGFTVSHTAGTAIYTVKFADAWCDFDSFWAKLASATLGVAAQVTQMPDVTNNLTMVIQVFDGSTKAAINDMAFDANTWLNFGIRMKNTSGNY